jgi:hypothetical protein
MRERGAQDANAAIVVQNAGEIRRSPRGRTEGFTAEEVVAVSIV